MITKHELEKIDQIRKVRASLMFILCSAYEHLFEHGKLTVEHSFENGFFCHDPENDNIHQDNILLLEKTIREWLGDNSPLLLDLESKDQILKVAMNGNLKNKVEIIQKWPDDLVPVIKYKQFWDLCYGPMTDKKSSLGVFELIKYNNGFIVRFPAYLNGDTLSAFSDQPKLFSIIKESEEWCDLLGFSTVTSLNEHIRNGSLNEIIWTAEGLQEKRISQIADALSNEFPWKRVITVAGPSSSGKTTFSKRLKIQLRVNGFKTLTMSMDDYFMDRDQIPVDENGNQDFEVISALNTELLSNQVKELVGGNSIKTRKFDFTTGKGSFTDQKLELGEWDFILLEGIHGLNPELTSLLDEESLQKIYVSAMTPLNIDRHHRVSTADNRLIRRMIRDLKFRGYSVADTLNRWPSVRAGEEKNIFPYQERADHMFNTALVYEPAILGPSILNELKIDEEDSVYIKAEKNRLRLFLSFFEPAEEDLVPGISILREFIGKSDFDY